MQNQKHKTILFVCMLILIGTLAAQSAFAAASATLSWMPPITDEGGGALTGLAGYKVYYNTTSTWLNPANNVTKCLLSTGIEIDVPGGATNSYRFENNLTPGQTYHFTVAAYDDAATPNLSKCALTDDATPLAEVSKRVSYTADINTSDSLHKVDLLDFNTFRNNWGNTDCDNLANFTGRVSGCTVNLLDFNILRADFGSSFL